MLDKKMIILLTIMNSVTISVHLDLIETFHMYCIFCIKVKPC